MKRFLAFITEASRIRRPSKGDYALTGDGHGDYYDREGNLVAKTVRGQLDLLRRSSPQQDPQQQQTQQEPDMDSPIEKTRGLLPWDLVASIHPPLVMKN